MADVSDLYGEGFDYPQDFDGNGGLARAKAVESVKASLFRLFDTAPGEEWFLPEYGCALKHLVFEEDSEVFRALADKAIREAVYRWEPRVEEIISLRIQGTTDAQPHTVEISVDFKLIEDQTIYNLVYPFYKG